MGACPARAHVKRRGEEEEEEKEEQEKQKNKKNEKEEEKTKTEEEEEEEVVPPEMQAPESMSLLGRMSGSASAGRVNQVAPHEGHGRKGTDKGYMRYVEGRGPFGVSGRRASVLEQLSEISELGSSPWTELEDDKLLKEEDKLLKEYVHPYSMVKFSRRLEELTVRKTMLLTDMRDSEKMFALFQDDPSRGLSLKMGDINIKEIMRNGGSGTPKQAMGETYLYAGDKLLCLVASHAEVTVRVDDALHNKLFNALHGRYIFVNENGQAELLRDLQHVSLELDEDLPRDDFYTLTKGCVITRIHDAFGIHEPPFATDVVLGLADGWIEEGTLVTWSYNPLERVRRVFDVERAPQRRAFFNRIKLAVSGRYRLGPPIGLEGGLQKGLDLRKSINVILDLPLAEKNGRMQICDWLAGPATQVTPEQSEFLVMCGTVDANIYPFLPILLATKRMSDGQKAQALIYVGRFLLSVAPPPLYAPCLRSLAQNFPQRFVEKFDKANFPMPCHPRTTQEERVAEEIDAVVQRSLDAGIPFEMLHAILVSRGNAVRALGS